MNQSEFLVIACSFLKAREKSRVQCAILFDFASHWLKKWREIFQPISKRSNRTRAITFDSHLKTAQTLNPRSAGPFVFIHSEETNPGGGNIRIQTVPLIRLFPMFVKA